MTDRKTLDQMTSNDLDQLHDQLDYARQRAEATDQYAAELGERITDTEKGITAATRQRKAAEDRAHRAEAAIERVRAYETRLLESDDNRQLHVYAVCHAIAIGLRAALAEPWTIDHGPETTGGGEPIPRAYQHFKGGTYEVIATGHHTETGEELVIYRSTTGWWCRPKAMFLDTVTVDGKERPCFTPADDYGQTTGHTITCTAAFTGACDCPAAVVEARDPCPACRRADQAGLAPGEQHPACAKEQH